MNEWMNEYLTVADSFSASDSFRRWNDALHKYVFQRTNGNANG